MSPSMQPHKRTKAPVKVSLRPPRPELAIGFGATPIDLFASPGWRRDPIIPGSSVVRARAPRQRQFRRKSRSTGGSKVAAIWELMKSADCRNVQTHKFLPLAGIVTALPSAHQSAFLRPVYYFLDEAFGWAAAASGRLANRRNWSSMHHQRKRCCTSLAK